MVQLNGLTEIFISFSDSSFIAAIGCLARLPKLEIINIYATTLMSRMMQGFGCLYVQYFNSKYGRTGTLWNGRFKSCLIQEEPYLLQVYKYIELNPVRAGMVADPGAYRWSSYQMNGLGEVSYLCTPHQEYLSLGKDADERQRNYREYLFQNIDEEVLKEIQTRTHQGMAEGNDQFKEEIV